MTSRLARLTVTYFNASGAVIGQGGWRTKDQLVNSLAGGLRNPEVSQIRIGGFGTVDNLRSSRRIRYLDPDSRTMKTAPSTEQGIRRALRDLNPDL